ncbi:MAG: DUF1080 domain-containing protein, partial [bacterium]|nr:DUF1080 domain-containing protein [bacterium]
ARRATDRTEDWTLLFDGRDFAGWRGLGRAGVPAESWVVENGCIHKLPSHNAPLARDGQPMNGGDLMTIATYRNFELSFDWKISPGGNSGLKYNVSEAMSTAHPPVHAALGFEYQILDDANHPDGQLPSHQTGALYDLIPPGPQRRVNPVGEFNRSKIVFNGNHGEHWINGAKLLEFAP